MTEKQNRPRLPEFVTSGDAEVIRNMTEIEWRSLMSQNVVSSEWDIRGDGTAVFNGIAEKPITTEREALDFFDIDLERWRVKGLTFRSWDVSMKIKEQVGEKEGKPEFEYKDIKRTNYGCKIELEEKCEQLEIRHQLIAAKTKEQPIIVERSEDVEMWSVIGCVHVPFHNKKLWAKYLTWLSEHKTRLTGLVINGDFLDLYNLSHYDAGKLPLDGITLRDEYEAGYEAILQLKQAAGREWNRWQKVFNYGNHENRFYKKLSSPDFFKLGIIAPHEGLKLDEHGFQVQTDYQNGLVQIGSVDVYHGKHTAKNAAQSALNDQPTRSHIFNHTHRIGYAENESQTSINIGWMGDANSPVFNYADRFEKSKWQNAFGVINVFEDTYVTNTIRVHNDRFMFDGKIY